MEIKIHLVTALVSIMIQETIDENYFKNLGNLFSLCHKCEIVMINYVAKSIVSFFFLLNVATHFGF